jgi:hypothetical protein
MVGQKQGFHSQRNNLKKGAGNGGEKLGHGWD